MNLGGYRNSLYKNLNPKNTIMKTFLRIFALVLSFGLITAQLQAQTLSTKYSARNSDEHVAQVIVTTDSTLTTIDSAKLSTNQTGILECTVIGYAKDTAYSVLGVIKIPFTKRRGTCTLGTIVEDVPITRAAVLTHTALGGATFTAAVINNNIHIRVKGVTDASIPSIRWYSITKLKSQATTLNNVVN